MISVLIFIAALALIVPACIGLNFFVSSIWEKERRAAIFGGFQFFVMLALVIGFFYLQRTGYFETTAGILVLTAGLILGVLALYFLIRKTAANPIALQGSKGLIVGEVKRKDEREIVFARNLSLRPGSEQYKIFYGEHPEWEADDARRRERGGTMGIPGAIDKPYEVPNLAASGACGALSAHLSVPEIVKPVAQPLFGGKKVDLSPEEATERVKGYTLNLGANSVGITTVNPLWIYSHRGQIHRENWEDWGKEILFEHKYAILFTTEMPFQVIAAAPHTTTSIASQCEYAKGALISTQLAQFISNLGYPSSANHLRHYEALMVPLAVDAGLGELSRMGYMITKELGPRVRLAAVTTDLPLVPDKPVDIGVEDFCRVCKKCAVCCPSNSIPMEEKTEVNGTLRWKLNAETCFDYWGKIGTGCNVCMRVCPWSHERTFSHKVIVELVVRNMISRRLFTIMDDVFYGRKPKSKAPPKWARFSATN